MCNGNYHCKIAKNNFPYIDRLMTSPTNRPFICKCVWECAKAYTFKNDKKLIVKATLRKSLEHICKVILTYHYKLLSIISALLFGFSDIIPKALTSVTIDVNFEVYWSFVQWELFLGQVLFMGESKQTQSGSAPAKTSKSSWKAAGMMDKFRTVYNLRWCGPNSPTMRSTWSNSIF